MATSDGFAFSTGLVEVSAVATLLGGPVAEKLALGEKAAAGLPWACMSAFGTMHVIKVCLSASLPDSAREVLGLRNDQVDAAVGACALVDNRRKTRRADLGDVCAIRMPHANDQEVGYFLPSQKAAVASVSDPAITVFYALDRTTKFILNTVSRSRSGTFLLIHQYVPDIQGHSSRFRDHIDGEIPEFKDNMVLLASCAKAIEIGVLFYLGARVLWWITAFGWAVAFPGAVMLHLAGLSRDHLSRPRTDLLSGTLPTHAVEGGDGILVLGLPENVRRHVVWRAVWALTALANLASLLGTFLSLRSQPPHVVYTWILFQAVWLLARSVVYRVLDGASACQGVLRSKSWDEASLSSRQRAMTLFLGLSKHQITLHPRGIRAYAHDTLSAPRIVSLFNAVHWALTDLINLPPPISNLGEEGKVDVLDVIGDTVLRSVAWARAPSLSTVELYDCALVFLCVDKVLHAVPSVRVYSCNCIQPSGRGNTHPDDCNLIEWVIFVPLRAGWWYLHGHQTKGYMLSEQLNDAELHWRLEHTRTWNISLRSTEEVRSILALSRATAELLRDLAQSI